MGETGLDHFFSELKRRKVVHVAAVYGVTAWLAAQVLALAVNAYTAPAWIMPMAVTLLLIGFPIALVLAWAFEVTPEGVQQTSPITGASAASMGGPTNKLTYTLIGLIIIALGWLLFRLEFMGPRDGAEVTPAVSVATEIDVSKSIAVLPLRNLSPDPENAYFAAGIHEEILGQLSKIKNLRVISRTSVLRYANTDQSLVAIGQELGVGAIMEGSVRFADNRVRITAQLIDTSNDAHLWAETYERDLEDIFAIQSDVAFSIAAAMQAELTEEERSIILKAPTDNLEAYNLFLVTRQRQSANLNWVDWTSQDNFVDLGIRDLERAVLLDPEFAVGFAELAFLHSKRMINFEQSSVDRALSRLQSNQAAERAIEIDRQTARAWDMLARNAYTWDYDWDRADTFFNIALAIEPQARTYQSYGMFLMQTGKVSEALQIHEKAVLLEPNPMMQILLAHAQYTGGEYVIARKTLEDYLALGGLKSRYNALLAMILLATGQEVAAFDSAQAAIAPGAGGQLAAMYGFIPFVAARTGHPEFAAAFMAIADRGAPGGQVDWPGGRVFAALGANDMDTAFEQLFSMIDRKDLIFFAPTIAPEFEILWDDPRMDEVRRRMNLIE